MRKADVESIMRRDDAEWIKYILVQNWDAIESDFLYEWRESFIETLVHSDG